MQACAQAPQAETPPQAPEPVKTASEIQLNLPEDTQCACVDSKVVDADYTFLEKGFTSLAAGNYAEATQYLQRYQRLENTPSAQWESAIALAYIDSLLRNPGRDLAGARTAFDALNGQKWTEMEVHPQSLVLRQALQNFLMQTQRTSEVESENQKLRGDLANREETIKRLRELTLGQKGVSP